MSSTVSSTSAGVSFSGTHIPYSIVFDDQCDHDLTGIFILYHAKRVNNIEDIVPVYLGYGNIASELRALEARLKFLLYEPLYYDYIEDPVEPERTLAMLRRQFKPVLPS